MNTLEGRAWRALAAAKGVGPKALWRIADYLADRKQTASWLLENPGKLTNALGVSKAGFAIPDLTLRENGGIEKFPGREVTLLHPLHPDFPQRIKKIKEMLPLPALLYVRGNVAILDRTSVSIVGKRDAGKPALAVADSLACALAARGINVTSGYAPGIDSAAHLAALRAGGTTVIVLAEGIHHFQTRPELVEFLTVDNVLVVSQFEPDARWAAYMAMARNKLVGALSGAVVVIASGPARDAGGRSSGTFDAGISALKMGIPVFVVAPGFFADDPQGNRELLKNGCREWDPATGAQPILAAIDSAAAKSPQPRQRSLFDKVSSDEQGKF